MGWYLERFANNEESLALEPVSSVVVDANRKDANIKVVFGNSPKSHNAHSSLQWQQVSAVMTPSFREDTHCFVCC